MWCTRVEGVAVCLDAADECGGVSWCAGVSYAEDCEDGVQVGHGELGCHGIISAASSETIACQDAGGRGTQLGALSNGG